MMIVNLKTFLLVVLLSHTAWCCIGGDSEWPWETDSKEIIDSGEVDPRDYEPDYGDDDYGTDAPTAGTEGTTPGTEEPTTPESTDGPMTRDPNGQYARDPSRMTREACEKGCTRNKYYTSGLVVDFNHPRYPKATKDPQNQDWTIGCLCFKQFPTVEIIQERCDTKVEKLDIGDFCSGIDQFSGCVDDDTLNYWKVACMYDLCPPKRSPSVDYHLREPGMWGPWCISMKKLEQQCVEQKPDFDLPEWKNDGFCGE